MATNLNIDNDLLAEAQHIGGFKTKRETVNSALGEFIAHHKQLAILELEGRVAFHEGYDHKVLRERKARYGDR